MRLKYIFLLSVLLSSSVHAQQDSIYTVKPENDSIDYSIDIQDNTNQPEPNLIDNSEATDLMIQLNTGDMEHSMKEAIITELIQNEANTTLQRRELEQQMELLHRDDSLRRALQKHRIDSLK